MCMLGDGAARVLFASHKGAGMGMCNIGNRGCLNQGVVCEARAFYLVKQYNQDCTEMPHSLGKRQVTQ